MSIILTILISSVLSVAIYHFGFQQGKLHAEPREGKVIIVPAKQKIKKEFKETEYYAPTDSDLADTEANQEGGIIDPDNQG